jgi:hypothetical protein
MQLLEPRDHSEQMKPGCIHEMKGNNSSSCFIFVEVYNLRPCLRVRKVKEKKNKGGNKKKSK